jgi:hypothetical protein
VMLPVASSDGICPPPPVGKHHLIQPVEPEAARPGNNANTSVRRRC